MASDIAKLPDFLVSGDPGVGLNTDSGVKILQHLLGVSLFAGIVAGGIALWNRAAESSGQDNLTVEVEAV